MKKIRLVSPAKHIDQHEVDFAENFLTDSGFDVEVGTYALGVHNYFSGTVEERLSDFQYALNDPTVDVILCTRGGYGAVQLVDQLDFSGFMAHPKLIIGYSDITVFHEHIPKNFNLPTIHATAPLNFSENTFESLSSLVNAINGKTNNYEIESHSLNILGEIAAPLTGGNLAIIHSMLGTNSEADYEGKILFIEDVGEAVYSIDRMFYALKKAGKLAQISGIIVGGLSNMKDSEVPFGCSVEEVIQQHIAPLNIPLCFNFPAGHMLDNRALIIGQKATLSVGEDNVTFEQ
ncbi:MAG: muramoyltetrapeptide carboxypeptidase [Crocinitomix sp.]|jgi:muramoyltetrapeptide carboxypeptidase